MPTEAVYICPNCGNPAEWRITITNSNSEYYCNGCMIEIMQESIMEIVSIQKVYQTDYENLLHDIIMRTGAKGYVPDVATDIPSFEKFIGDLISVLEWDQSYDAKLISTDWGHFEDFFGDVTGELGIKRFDIGKIIGEMKGAVR